MRTNEERAALVRQRVKEIKEEQIRKKQKVRLAVPGAVCLAGCLLILVVIGNTMPRMLSGVGEVSVSHTSGAASLLAENQGLGYVMIAVFAFLLGCCVTLLLHVIHRRQQRQMRESDSKESDKNE